MRTISIGNDFRVAWRLTQFGEAFDLSDKHFTIDVKSSYGTITVDDIQVIDGNVITFSVPAREQIYLGKYDITLTINSLANGQAWVLTQCDAFELVPCGSCSDMPTVVQFDSGIVYPSNGLSAYEIAVLNGYKGTYEEWVKWYAEPSRVRVSFSPFGTDESYDMGDVSGALLEQFFESVPESTWEDIDYDKPEEPEKPEAPEEQPMYPYYAYGDMGWGENFAGIGAWDDVEAIEEV